ncbi:response regulator transcription factor [Chloroflexota bacterium]
MVKSEKPDIMILDLGLPEMSGFKVLRQIRRFSKVPVLMMTVTAEEDQIARALGLGANDYMVKPFSYIELQERMRALLTTS